MEQMMREAEPDGPHGLLAAEEAHQQLHRAVHVALVPVLKRYEQDQIGRSEPPEA